MRRQRRAGLSEFGWGRWVLLKHWFMSKEGFEEDGRGARIFVLWADAKDIVVRAAEHTSTEPMQVAGVEAGERVSWVVIFVGGRDALGTKC
jgi:hypothetical protein